MVVYKIRTKNVVYPFFLLDVNVNFDKSTIGLHFLLISFMITKFLKDQRLIVILSIKCLKINFVNRMVNNTLLR